MLGTFFTYNCTKSPKERKIANLVWSLWWSILSDDNEKKIYSKLFIRGNLNENAKKLRDVIDNR